MTNSQNCPLSGNNLDNEENIPHDCKTMYKNIPINNICLVSKHFQCLNSRLDVNLLTELIKNFKNIIEKNLNIDINNEKKYNEYLFFPRNKKYNFKPNDRNFDYTKVYEMLKNKKYIEYDTMNTDNFKNQIELLLSSKNIFLDWGSSFFVFLPKSKKINNCKNKISIKICADRSVPCS